jgi:long-chain acyl-CoA synthetase
LGVPLLEGYGLTEAGPVVSANRPDNNVPGSVGKPLPGVEVKLSEHGELLVRSASVMLGYWQREEATRRTIDEDGWLYTGDLAEITAGRIYLRGRIKEILVTSTGEKVAPADMEMAITLDPLFEQAMVVGEGKPFLVALLVLNPNAWAQLAGKLHLDATDKASLYNQNTIAAVIDKLNELVGHFPGYAQIRAVYLCLEPWTIEDGSLTPTLKIKRDILATRFAQQIDELYRGHAIVN